MSSSEPSPEPVLASKKTKKSKDSTKKKSKKSAAFVSEDAGLDEGTDPELALKPPSGAVLVDHSGDFGDFDWDKVNDDENLELWLIRVPDGLKTKYLHDLRLDIPSSSKTMRVGHIDRKTTTFDVWSLGEDQVEAVGGEELKGFTCLLPRRRKGGKLYQAPKPVARHLVISARPSLPTPDPSAESSGSSPIYKNPPRPRIPPELLKHRFMPLGSEVSVGDAPEVMEVDEVEQVTAEKATAQGSAAKTTTSVVPTVGDPEGTRKKRRKVDVDPPRKSKKTKTTLDVS